MRLKNEEEEIRNTSEGWRVLEGMKDGWKVREYEAEGKERMMKDSKEQ